ncbi:hypothetical protein CN933_25140 [Sinorhizobium sp. M4_45]|nr:hypothetical protein CN933_25140 [Sinorhizobium sp. M4_45]
MVVRLSDSSLYWLSLMPHFVCGAFNLPAISPRGELAFLERGRGEFWLAVLIAAARRDAEVRLATACTA